MKFHAQETIRMVVGTLFLSFLVFLWWSCQMKRDDALRHPQTRTGLEAQ